MTDYPERLVFIKDPKRLHDAIMAFREEAESIQFQELYGDLTRPPLKVEFDAFAAKVEDYLQRILKTLDGIASQTECACESSAQPTFADVVDAANKKIAEVFAVPSTSLLTRGMTTSEEIAAMSIDERLAFIQKPVEVDDVYANADVEDGVAPAQADQGLSADECNCVLCKPLRFTWTP